MSAVQKRAAAIHSPQPEIWKELPKVMCPSSVPWNEPRALRSHTLDPPPSLDAFPELQPHFIRPIPDNASSCPQCIDWMEMG